MAGAPLHPGDSRLSIVPSGKMGATCYFSGGEDTTEMVCGTCPQAEFAVKHPFANAQPAVGHLGGLPRPHSHQTALN